MPSMCGQDSWVLSLIKKSGFFLDTGGGLPRHISNTDVLEDRGWIGVASDPVPEYCEMWKKERKCPCFKVAVDVQDGNVIFTRARETDLWSGITKYMSEGAKNYIQDSLSRHEEVQAWTLKHLLDEVKAPKIIHYWSLDTEGSELALINSFPWNEHDVILMTVEHNFHELNRGDIQKALKTFGLTFDAKASSTTGADDCFVNYDLLPLNC